MYSSSGIAWKKKKRKRAHYRRYPYRNNPGRMVLLWVRLRPQQRPSRTAGLGSFDISQHCLVCQRDWLPSERGKMRRGDELPDCRCPSNRGAKCGRAVHMIWIVSIGFGDFDNRNDQQRNGRTYAAANAGLGRWSNSLSCQFVRLPGIVRSTFFSLLRSAGQRALLTQPCIDLSFRLRPEWKKSPIDPS